MQDPNTHQTDINSVIGQDETARDTADNHDAAIVRVSESVSVKTKAPGLRIARRYTEPGEDVWSTVEWEKRSAVITGERGEVVFEQHDIDVPKTWTQLATNVVASKYFRGHIGSPERERSVRQLIQRVSYTMADWGKAMGYFASEADYLAFRDELTHLLLHQKAAFNSPVWFNVGLPDLPRPQVSACFINSVKDTMESILTLAKTEGMLFKYGSGTGTNLSTLRSSKEKLQGGGTASGPVSFMRGYDAFAGVIKSGGKTRRAAKMVILNIDHPDIKQFITCKAEEEKKAWALIDAGYNGNFNVPGGAYDSIAYQNANHSVRVTDEFMEAYLNDREWHTRYVLGGGVAETYQAKDLMRWIAESAWVCGDPGMQYDTTINRWHTCKNTDRINASNPCSEFVFLDDTACNLSSINLMKFRREDGEFDVEGFQHACRIMITAQEIIVDNASYPTEAIARNSHDYRPLGLGYANLGALLMARGVAYDSDEGRALASAITAVMTGEAYHQSAIIARDHGWPFPGYPKNREPFLDVMRMHRASVEQIDANYVPADLLAAARASWDNALAVGEQHGFRNAQATVLAPTGTISFLMDCDTTGIEPDIAIVKYKNLVGGGVMKIVNNTVPEALKRLGYTPQEVNDIVAYIDANDTIEGAPGLKEEHLPIFDCAFKPAKGSRSIHYMGHVKMMAATQPFISGAISKCVTGETLLYTERGILPIREFYAGEKPGNFTPCELTLGSIDSPQRADLFYYGGVRPTIRLTLADGRTIEGTPNHRVKVANAQGYDWKRLDEITPDDYVAIRLGTDVWAVENARIAFEPSALYGRQRSIRIPERMSPALGRFLGYYIAGGNMTHTNWMVRITNNNERVLRRCQETVRDLFGLEGRIETDARNGVKSFVVASKTLVELLTYLGASGNSANREIPWSVLQSRREVLQEFIAGLWLDGFVRQDGMVAICLNTEKLIRQLQVVLNNFGLRTRILRKYCKEYDKYFWEMEMHGNDARRFASLFHLDDPHKVQALRATGARAKKTDAVHSDVVPCYRTNLQAAVLAAHDTMAWRSLFDKRTRHLSWQMVARAYAHYPLPELKEIVENNIHFVQVKETAGNFAEVYDFQVPENHAFIGNGIVNHNTVNMPNEATVEDIMGVYVEGWRLGLKAIAIYRDGSKRTQPLVTRRAEGEAEKPEMVTVPIPVPAAKRRPVRRRLPDERKSITHKFSIAGHEGYITVGMYDDGSPGEIFLTMSKEGSTISGLMDTIATMTSLALQYGVPLETLVSKFAHTRFEPSGVTPNPDIRFAKSISDYIFRWLGLKFLPKEALPAEEKSLNGNGHPPAEAVPAAPASEALASEAAPPPAGSFTDREREIFELQADAPACAECGALMVRNGACYKCLNCGSVFGCS